VGPRVWLEKDRPGFREIMVSPAELLRSRGSLPPWPGFTGLVPPRGGVAGRMMNGEQEESWRVELRILLVALLNSENFLAARAAILVLRSYLLATLVPRFIRLLTIPVPIPNWIASLSLRRLILIGPLTFPSGTLLP
jgi:hypothetical protein